MAAPDDNLNDDIMADIINAGTNADVDDTSQYFADYEDILNIPVVEDQQIVAQKNTARSIFDYLSSLIDACVRIFIVNHCVSTHVAGVWIYINHRQE